MDTGSTGIGDFPWSRCHYARRCDENLSTVFRKYIYMENLFTGTESDKKINQLEFENGVSRSKSGKFYVL